MLLLGQCYIILDDSCALQEYKVSLCICRALVSISLWCRRGEEKSEAGTIKSVCFSVGLVLNLEQVQAGIVYGNTL